MRSPVLNPWFHFNVQHLSVHCICLQQLFNFGQHIMVDMQFWKVEAEDVNKTMSCLACSAHQKAGQSKDKT
jgi:hypothetical protein